MRVGIVSFCLLLGCSGATAVHPPGGETGGTPDDETPRATSSGAADGAGPMPPAVPTDDDDDGGGFISYADANQVVDFECDLYAQDCGPGEKCNPYSNDGGPGWNATRCVPVIDDPADKGAPCRRLDGVNNGVDDCGYGSVCWDVDEEGWGMCVPLCMGSAEAPYCDEPSETCAGGKSVQVCLPICDPLGLDGDAPCPVGCACYPSNDTFICAPDASGDLGSHGDPCEFINSCDPGQACIGADAVPDCQSGVGCCAAYCDTDAADACAEYDGAVACVSWFVEGMEPPLLERVGVCALPQ